ncbi:MAG: hypothetical protein M1377_08655 [Deltaproteobacteria bacterium]|nr:hypothetical protein [Deltaproteobacteria bacterium]
MKENPFPLKSLLCSIFALMVLSPECHAAHPLITDDAGTQGKGKYQVEVNGQYDYDKETENGVTTKETGSEVAGILSYGVTDHIDVVLGLSYQWIRTKEGEATSSTEDGISDVSVELKWRFYEKDGLGFALNPALRSPRAIMKKDSAREGRHSAHVLSPQRRSGRGHSI